MSRPDPTAHCDFSRQDVEPWWTHDHTEET